MALATSQLALMPALIAWANQAREGKGLVRLPDGRMFLAHSGGELIGPPLPAGTFGTLRIQFVPDGKQVVGARVFELDLVAFDEEGRPTGGQRFLLKTTLGLERPCWDTQLDTFDGVAWIPGGRCACIRENCRT